jgi:hypothetical protein
MKAIIKQIFEEAYHFGTSRIVLGRLREIENNPHNSKANTLEAGFSRLQPWRMSKFQNIFMHS